MEKIQLIAILGSIFFMIGVIELIRRKQIKEAYALLWLIFGTVFVVFSIWKKGLDFIASLVGVYYPPALLFLVMMVAIVLILIQFSVVISRNNDKVKNLAQEIALLKKQIEDENKPGNKN
ncbi:MAG TPA: DUF2304 domain-containing protein [Candidatus Rifleibacterium sp.]|nr:DUF2304 domain-containing protein [Candidatus Rifleibacterium sp.]HPT47059.1 DUF2304 domain-containing protein [Candidatus Rifleibacterium sp.]